jgi:membrane protein required for colicin V production
MNLSSVSSIHPFDAIIVIGAIIFLIIGIKRGLIEELFRLAGLIGGVLVAVRFNSILSPFLDFTKLPIPTRNAIAFILIFAITLVLIVILGWLFKKVVHLTPAAWADWLFGGLFGVLKVLVLAWVFALSVEASPFRTIKMQFDESKAYPILASIPFKLKIPFVTFGNQKIVIRKHNGRTDTLYTEPVKKTMRSYKSIPKSTTP